MKLDKMLTPPIKASVISFVLVLAAASDARSEVATNVWIGAASGGSWKNPANWRAMSAKGYSAEELFQRYTVYDLRGLAAGAVLTNDYSGGNAYNLDNSTGQTFVYGLVASGEPGDVWTVVPGANVGAIRFCAPSTIESSVCEFGATPKDATLYVALGHGCEKPYLRFKPFDGGLPQEMDQSSTAAERLATHVEGRHNLL